MIRPALLALFMAGPALGEAVAFVQAPEMGGGIGRAPTIDEAIAKGRAQCAAESGDASACIVTAACAVAGWSVDVFVQHREGNHWHESHCALPDRDTARAVGEALCNIARRPFVIDCAVVGLWAPDGTQTAEGF